MRQSKKYLTQYKRWMKNRKLYSYMTVISDLPTMPKSGLCASLNEDLKLFRPTMDEYLGDSPSAEDMLLLRGYETKELYWGATGNVKHFNDAWMNGRYFSPMRQTIVLFLAAMNDEL